ncbi:unnamed protein product [Fusarium fujikuroi]|uniref:O-methylsterigmatocystin oxidoreductase n=1 Tax=Fusarium fujikuroi TaxID=5127 RepID=A0A9Q9RW53_FUSFU|nr:unnamed protein product [Fusarium fujikuroi]
MLSSLLLLCLIIGRPQRRLPPGPKPLPIVGNIKDMPPAHVPEYKHWLRHKDLYGPISSVTVLGMILVIIHDKEAAHDLLEKSSLKTSGRPDMTFVNKMCGYSSWMITKGYTSVFRKHRKLIHQELGSKSRVSRFHDVQETEVNRQLVRALKEPNKWLEHLRTTSGATMLSMTYGYTVEPTKPDRLIGLIEQSVGNFSIAAVPLTWLVDMVPALQYIPRWFPGASFQALASQIKHTLDDVTLVPYRFVKEQMVAKSHKPSYVSKVIEKAETFKDGTTGIDHDDEDAIIWTAAVMFAGGADTTVVTMTAFTMAMIRFPNVQSKAQQEIDSVVGQKRLPNFDDRHKLPYINALVKESLRWWPVVPMAFQHRADEDIEYRDFCIPKGSYLLPAVWWFLHDPEVYADPDAFDPERFLTPRDEPDPGLHAFGYGRRICPGRVFADSILYLNIVRSLAAFKFSKAIDERGKEINPDIVEPPGLLNRLEPFTLQVEPRTPHHRALIQKLEDDGILSAGDSVHLEKLWS